MTSFLIELFSLPGPEFIVALGPLGVGLALGGIGALVGAQGSKQSATQSIQLSPASDFEKFSGQLSQDQLKQLQALVGAGAGEADVAAGAQSQRDLAGMLEGLVSSGGLPTQSDIQSAQGFASDIFAPQRQALETQFTQSNEEVAQLAAQLGRPVNDPILQAKLARFKGEQVGQLSAQQGAFAAQEARNLPLQRLGFAESLTNVRQGLASQAFSNRQALATLGSQFLAGERNFRLGAANRTTTSRSGGGLEGAISGALAGAGTGIKLGGLLGGGGGSSLGLTGSQSLTQPALGSSAGLGSQPQFLSGGSFTFGPQNSSTSISPGRF